MANIKTLKTSNPKDILPFAKKIQLPVSDSHKGQNGKVLIIGGSQLFHSASLWSAEVASHFADMVHYASTEENNEIFLSLKKKFRNGIIVRRDQLESYIKEDDVILIGPGLERNEETRKLTQQVLRQAQDKQLVIDAGSLQMMKPEWLKSLKKPAIITPHQQEFEKLFGVSLGEMSNNEKAETVRKTAKQYKCVILMKSITDFVSNGEAIIPIEGGNQGLTKGGTGDILAGLVSGLVTHSDSISACVCASFVLKKTADELLISRGYWYNNSDILDTIPKVVNLIFI